MEMEMNGMASRGTESVRRFDPDVPLHAILSALPEGTMLPAGWVLARIAGTGASTGSRAATLSAQEFGDQRVPRRTADWVRQQCAEGRIEGAFKDGGEWRIPLSALTQQIPRSRSAQQIPTINNDARPARQGGVPTYPRW